MNQLQEDFQILSNELMRIENNQDVEVIRKLKYF